MSHITHTGVTLANYRGVDSAITQRPTSTALLAIDSEDRYESYTQSRVVSTSFYNWNPYNFVIEKKQSLMSGFFTRLGVTEVVFPWTIGNINAKTNKINFTYTIASVATTVTIALDEGFYLPSQIASALQTAIRAIDASLVGVTVTYGVDAVAGTNAVKPIFQVRSPGILGPFINFTPMTNNSSLYPYDAKTKQLFDLLGFSDINSVDAKTQTGGETFCQATRYIDIVCSQLVNNQALKDTMSQPVARDSLCRLYLVDPSTPSNTPPTSSTFCPPGCAPFTIYRDFNSPKMINWIPNQPVGGSLRFEVYDDNGDILSDSISALEGNKTNWSLTLLVTEN
jgi:hypothetical protein